MSESDSLKIAKAKKAGHVVASIDEEVPAFAEGSGDLLWVSRKAVALCDRVFCLGRGHRDSLAGKWPDQRAKLVLTGNPRWDFLRPELRMLYQEQADRLRQQHGRMILINTNSGNVNPASRTPEQVLRDYIRTKKIDPKSTRDMAFWNDYWNFEQANFKAAPELAMRLAREFKDHTIILRPHPSERLASYAERLENQERVKVLFEGAAAPWILAADLLIHTDCTTGIEAFALGKPSICFETVPSVLHTQLLSGRLSFTVQTEDDVVREATRLLVAPPEGNIYPSEMVSLFRHFFAAQDGPLAAVRVIEAVIEALGITRNEVGHQTVASWRPSWRFRPSHPALAAKRKKFPTMEIEVVKARLKKIAGALGLQEPPMMSVCGEDLLHLYDARLKGPKPAGNALTRTLLRALRG